MSEYNRISIGLANVQREGTRIKIIESSKFSELLEKHSYYAVIPRPTTGNAVKSKEDEDKTTELHWSSMVADDSSHMMLDCYIKEQLKKTIDSLDQPKEKAICGVEVSLESPTPPVDDLDNGMTTG